MVHFIKQNKSINIRIFDKTEQISRVQSFISIVIRMSTISSI